MNVVRFTMLLIVQHKKQKHINSKILQVNVVLSMSKLMIVLFQSYLPFQTVPFLIL
jgi:hypothetical protein